MTDYTELLELLRYCSSQSGCIGCKLSEAYDCTADLTRDAAAAIEELQQIADHYEQTAKDYWKEACDYKAQLEDRTNATELWKDMYLTKQMPQDDKDKILEYIRNAPIGPLEPVQIEQLPKRGKWELIDGAEPMRWGCSRCKYMSWETSNYCPRCGAKMEVQE